MSKRLAQWCLGGLQVGDATGSVAMVAYPVMDLGSPIHSPYSQPWMYARLSVSVALTL
jgi:hypothetical protein